MSAQPLLLFCPTRKNDLEGVCVSVCVWWGCILSLEKGLGHSPAPLPGHRREPSDVSGMI